MSDVFDYLTWRGDISFKDSPFNEVDNIILCLLTYINFTDVVPEVFSSSITIQEASKADYSLRRIPDPRLYQLLDCCGKSRRFRDVLLTGYSEVFKEDEDCQFGALTFLFQSGSAYISFRGTDCSVTGLKEDFNMIYKAPIPSQACGVHYLTRFMKELGWWKRRHEIQLGGHSKGGNVAQYAAVHGPKTARHYIRTIWSNDGPGFNEELFPKEWITPLIPSMKTLLPSNSIIGRLFDHQEAIELITSSDSGFNAHDPFTWVISGPGIVRAGDDAPQPVRFDRSFRDWMHHISFEERKQIVDAIYEVFCDMGIKTMFDFRDFKLSQAVSGIKALTQLDSELKKALVHGITQFYKSYMQNQT